MVNIFDTLPRNFFNIFNTADRVVISECICVLYEYIKDDASFASLKENLIYELTKYKNRLDKMEGKTMSMLVTTGLGVMVLLIFAVLLLMNI